MLASIGRIDHVVIENYTAHGTRTQDSTEGLRVGGFVQGWAHSVWPNATAHVHRPALRKPHLRRATKLLADDDIAQSRHIVDAIAHLLCYEAHTANTP